MLRSLRVRTRLMVVIAVPLFLLAVVAVPEVGQRRDDARAADRAERLAGHAADVAVAVDALQTERLLAAAARAGAADEVAGALGAQRAVVDRALRPVAASQQDVTDPELRERAERALDRLADIRDEMDAAESIVPWFDPYEAVIGPLLELQEAFSAAAAGMAGGGDLPAAALVGRAKEATAAQAAQVAAAVVWGELRGEQQGILASLRADEQAYRTAYLAAQPGDPVAARAELQQAPVSDVGRAVDGLVDGAPVSGLGGLSAWQGASRARQDVLRGVEAARTDAAVDAIAAAGSEARREATLYGALMAAGFAAALALAVVTARSITRPLGRLTRAADDLAEERLPRLVEALRHPSDDDERYLAATAEPLEADGADELARLSRAFNEVQSVAVTVAAEQSTLLRKGISDLYVNLARRNQALIERQIGLLDRLEAEEQDPDALEHLYQLDHLATRMRRNAESLLVMAGAEGGPRRSRPLAVADVVRAALSEVEQFHRIELGELTPAVLRGHAVSDVAHILAELLENATHFSPPTTKVRVEGARTGGSYQLMVVDEGLGIPEEQLEHLNDVLADPPVTGLAMSRSLGVLVAARLAARHGVTVRLRRGEVGTIAYVVLPKPLLADDEPISGSAAPGAGGRGVRIGGRAPRTAPDAPASLQEALPSAETADAELEALVAAPSGRAAEPSAEVPARPAAATPAGLPRRRPGAHADAFARPAEDAPRTRRSPEEVRAMLSRYRSGRAAARRGDAPTGSIEPAGAAPAPVAPVPDREEEGR